MTVEQLREQINKGFYGVFGGILDDFDALKAENTNLREALREGIAEVADDPDGCPVALYEWQQRSCALLDGGK